MPDSARTLRVLLIEDDEDDLVLTRALLQEIDGVRFHLEWASEYGSAVDMVRRGRFDILLVDFHLGERTGIELLDELNARELDAPAILLTGQGDRDVDRAAMAAGATDYLVKGQVDAALLDRAIRYALDQKRTERTLRFLAASSAALASSLDPESALEAVAGLAVPELGAWSVILLAEPEPGLPPHAVATGDAERRTDLLVWVDRSSPLRELAPPDLLAVLDTAVARPVRMGFPASSVPGKGDDATPDPPAIAIPLQARGRVLGLLVTGRDVDGQPYGSQELAVAEEFGRRAGLAIDNARLFNQAQRAIRARDEVLGIVSHELRNPLFAIQTCAEILGRALPEGDSGTRARSYLELVDRSVKQMDRLIEDLLDVARIEAGRLSIQRLSRPLEPIVEAAVSQIEPAAREKEIDLNLEIPGALPSCALDTDRMLQVLGNLLGNAVKFTPRGGSIEVRAEAVDGSIHLTVRDTGPGIEPADLERIFDRFWQAHAARRAGAGLGLAIARGLVELHDGRLWAESAPGQGATFRIALPQG